MPTRNISLTPEQHAFIDEVLEAGEYQNASEAVRDAIRALQQRRAEDALKLERLRLAIQAGVDALERGKYTEVADDTLDAYLDSLAEGTPTQSVRRDHMARCPLSDPGRLITNEPNLSPVIPEAEPKARLSGTS